MGQNEIDKADQLDALPSGAVVVTAGRIGEGSWSDGDAWGEGSWTKGDDGWYWWPMDYAEPATEVPLPARLIWEPKRGPT